MKEHTIIYYLACLFIFMWGLDYNVLFIRGYVNFIVMTIKRSDILTPQKILFYPNNMIRFIVYLFIIKHVNKIQEIKLFQ